MGIRVVQLNGGVFGSTGKIMFGIADSVEKSGGLCRCYSPITTTNRRQEQNHAYSRIGTFFSRRLNVLLERITGLSGCFSLLSTMRMLREWRSFAPDIIQLHNIHGSFVNLPMLFRFSKKYDVPIIWTLHDCWAFTGHCAHYTMAGCSKWVNGCRACPQYREYPKSWFDNAAMMYRLKKRWLTDLKRLTIVTPSVWLSEEVSKSYLKDHSLTVIHNGIDLAVFKPTPSAFREKYHIPKGKMILLGVAFGWGRKKGLDVFVALAARLDPEKYQIVLVGTDDHVDKKLPPCIISIHRTADQQELAEIYTAADLFVNPTREENYPTVNMEAIACGTPVLTFRTGGSPEILNEKTGAVVDCDNISLLEESVLKISEQKSYDSGECIEYAKSFDMNVTYEEYLRVYKEVLGESAATNTV